MKKRLMSILLVLCMVIAMFPVTAMADTAKKTPAHGILGDSGYYIHCLSGGSVTADTYESVRSVQINFPDTPNKVFFVENQGNNQVVLKVTNSYSSTGYSYIGLDGSAKDGAALRTVDKPFVWNVYKESNSSLDFSLRPASNAKLVVNAAGGKSNPRTKIILSTETKMKAPKHGIFRFVKAPDQSKVPVAADYMFGNLMQNEGEAAPVKIEPMAGKSAGEVTVLYNGSPALPVNPGSYIITFDVAAAPPMWKEAKGLSAGNLTILPKPSTAVPVGQSIKMGGINWRVLDVRDGKALVISELILETKKYQDKFDSKFVWAESSMRDYLNGDFYNKTFSQAEKDRILSTQLINYAQDSFSFNTATAETTDKIFLLSIEEVNRYFSDNNARIAYADRRAPGIINSEVNSGKTGYEGVWQPYSKWLWWLRTPFSISGEEAYCINIEGDFQPYHNSFELGVRPVMWIKAEGNGFTPYQPLKFNPQPNYFTKEDMVLAIAEDIIHDYAGDWVYKMGYGARGPAVQKAQELGGTNNLPPGYLPWFSVFRMRCWGVIGFDYFDPLAEVTYGEFRDNLMKTMSWFKQYAAEGANYFTFTKDALAIAEKKAGISNTSANAKPVKAEIKRLTTEVKYWLAAANAGHSGVRLLKFPTKEVYKVGEGFDTTGLLVVSGPYGKETNLNDKIVFKTDGITLTQGRPFQTASKKTIELYYNGVHLGSYPVNVKK